MKAISIQQPWAWAIVHAGKDVENRKWNTSYRGPIAIHASATLQQDHTWPQNVRPPAKSELHLSAIIGVAKIIDVTVRGQSKWFKGPFGILLADSRPLVSPVPCKGELGLWTIPSSVLRIVQKQLPGNSMGFRPDLKEHEATLQKSYDVASIRRQHNQAYRPWSEQDDEYLRRRFFEGAAIDDLVSEFGRQPGGIRSRLRKLGLDPRAAGRTR